MALMKSDLSFSPGHEWTTVAFMHPNKGLSEGRVHMSLGLVSSELRVLVLIVRVVMLVIV